MASRRVSNPRTGAIPKQPRGGSANTSRPGSASTSRPGSAGTKVTSTKKGVPSKPPTCPMAAAKLKKQQKEEPEPEPPPKAYENPAFSIPLKRVQTNPLLADKEKKKTIRRNIPPGEDLKEIKKILVSLKNKDITVGEFVALIGPSTGDNGEVFRTVLTEEMNSFRNLARRIYDTMTQDVSDVLTNQHIQLKEYEQERTTLYTEKMMRAINEIYSYAPKFDFEAYYAHGQKYLDSLFPIPKLIEADSDEAEMHRRQQAFHRLNWLRTEGDRLAAENSRLQARLNELKREQKEELAASEARESEAETKREELEAQEAAMQQQLEHLTDKVEETMIDTEAAMRVAADEANILAPVKKASSKAAEQRRRKKKPDWASDTAAEIDEKAVEENIIAEGAQSDAVEPQSVAGAVKRVRSQTSRTKFRRPEATTPEKRAGPRKPASPFHFSPLKTPPSKPPPPKERSPFHFSPLKTPPPRVQVQKPPSPFHFSPPKSPPRPEPPQMPISPPPQLHTTRLRTEKVTVQERTPRAGLFPPGGVPAYTPQPGLSAPGTGFEEATPFGQEIPSSDPNAPPRMGPLPAQRPAVQKMPELEHRAAPARPPRRGQEYAPKDSWGGFG